MVVSKSSISVSPSSGSSGKSDVDDVLSLSAGNSCSPFEVFSDDCDSSSSSGGFSFCVVLVGVVVVFFLVVFLRPTDRIFVIAASAALRVEDRLAILEFV